MTDLFDLFSVYQPKIDFKLDEGSVKVRAVEPLGPAATVADGRQGKQYTHITKNGIHWNLNPSQS